jgi:hypothetical protein
MPGAIERGAAHGAALAAAAVQKRASWNFASKYFLIPPGNISQRLDPAGKVEVHTGDESADTGVIESH